MPKKAKPVESPAPEPNVNGDDTSAAPSFWGIGEGKVIHVNLDEIDLEDEKYRFRVSIRTEDLEKSMNADGQQIPVVLRSRQGHEKYQLISGFRRCNAARDLKWSKVAAVVRHDLVTEDDAFRASVLENSARKTYSDIDRANVLRLAREAKMDSKAVERLLGVKGRQVENLRSLLELPKEVQAAIDDSAQHFGATHALVIRRASHGIEDFAWQPWISAVNDDTLSVDSLKLALRKAQAQIKGVKPKLQSIFHTGSTDLKSGKIGFARMNINVADLSEGEKSQLRKELMKVVGLLKVQAGE